MSSGNNAQVTTAQKLADQFNTIYTFLMSAENSAQSDDYNAAIQTARTVIENLTNSYTQYEIYYDDNDRIELSILLSTIVNFIETSYISQTVTFPSFGDLQTEIKKKIDAATAELNSASSAAEFKLILYDDIKYSLQEIKGYPNLADEIREAYFSAKSNKRGLALAFTGPPGTGKTITAQATAKEFYSDIFIINPGDILDMYFGNSEKNIAKLFDTARKHAKDTRKTATIFLDEGESLFAVRKSTGQSAPPGVITTFLQYIDGVFTDPDDHKNIIILTATNLWDDFDPAIQRRFKRIEIPNADENGRYEIMREEFIKQLNAINIQYSNQMQQQYDPIFRKLAKKNESNAIIIRNIQNAFSSGTVRYLEKVGQNTYKVASTQTPTSTTVDAISGIFNLQSNINILGEVPSQQKLEQSFNR